MNKQLVTDGIEFHLNLCPAIVQVNGLARVLLRFAFRFQGLNFATQCDKEIDEHVSAT